MVTQQEELEASSEETKKLVGFYKQVVARKTKKVVEIIKNVNFADNDYKVFLDKKLGHYLEVKVRRNKFNEYPTTKIPLRKHATAEHYFVANKLKTYLLLGFSDGVIAVQDLTQEPDSVEDMVARHDRGEDRDIYALYKTNKLTILKRDGNEVNDSYWTQEQAHAFNQKYPNGLPKGMTMLDAELEFGVNQ